MFHCGDTATSQSLWFTFEDTNRILLRMWQKPGSELLWIQTKHSQTLLARGERHYEGADTVDLPGFCETHLSKKRCFSPGS